MATDLSNGAILILMSPEWAKIEPKKPVLQVIDFEKQPLCLNRYKGVNKIVLSDGLYHCSMMHLYMPDRPQQLRKGSIVQLDKFKCCRMYNQNVVMIMELNVIRITCDIIGDPKPFTSVMINTPKLEKVATQEDSKQESNCSRNRKRKGENLGRMMLEECIEKMEKLGWENHDDKPSKSIVNDEGKTTELEEDGMGNKRRKATIEECVDKLKGLRLVGN